MKQQAVSDMKMSNGKQSFVQQFDKRSRETFLLHQRVEFCFLELMQGL
jgi:hypothetical protein